jgi:hypothetical protein
MRWVNTDPDTMVAQMTPKPTRKTEVLDRTPPIIVLFREEDTQPKYR